MNKRDNLNLIHLHSETKPVRSFGEVPSSQQLHDVRQGLEELLSSQGMLVPADCDLLFELWPSSGICPEKSILRMCIDQLISDGEYRKVIVGREAHLTLGNKRKIAKQIQQTQSNEIHEPEDVDSQLFNLQVSIDVEHERVLLYRILLVLGGIGALLLLREGALWWFLL